MLDKLKLEIIRILARVQVKAEEDVEAVDAQRRQESQMEFRHDEAGMAGAENQAATPQAGHETFVREGRKIGRNEACPCGSGRKYKHCHGKLT